jgi:hypothetical protein
MIAIGSLSLENWNSSQQWLSFCWWAFISSLELSMTCLAQGAPRSPNVPMTHWEILKPIGPDMATWSHMHPYFDHQTENAWQMKQMGHGDKYRFTFCDNTRTGPLEYEVDFVNFVQLNFRTNERRKIRKVATQVVADISSLYL